MSFGWKALLPIAVLSFLITAILIVLSEEGVFDTLFTTVTRFFGG
jgi:hypothetical protein